MSRHGLHQPPASRRREFPSPRTALSSSAHRPLCWGSAKWRRDCHRYSPPSGPPRRAASAADGLLDWLEQPTTDRGLHFASDDGSWSYWDYPRLARLVAEAAEKIEAERTRDSGPISIALPAGPQFVAAFLGALVAGHTPSPLALPVFLRDPEGYVRHVAKILEAADPALVISDSTLTEPLTHAIAHAGLDGTSASSTSRATATSSSTAARRPTTRCCSSRPAPRAARAASRSPTTTSRPTSRRCSAGSGWARTAHGAAGCRSTTTWA